MRIREQVGNRCTVLELDGRLTGSALDRLTEAIEEALLTDSLAVLVDMRGVVFADAAALRALATLQRRLRAGGRAMGISGLRPQASLLMTLIGLPQGMGGSQPLVS